MAALRVFLCDDEPLALDRLGELLSRCSDVEIVGSALTGSDLIDQLPTAKPDLVLLDIEMPRMDGFDVVEGLSRMARDGAMTPPLIVFVTAHPELAADAFDSGALDFISKPVRLSRLEKALDRARQAAEQFAAGQRLEELSRQLDDLKQAHYGAGPDAHVWLRRGAETIRVDVEAIDWIGAEGEYVRIHVGADSYLERGSMTDAAVRFGPFGFARIHRSTVVNPARIASIEKTRWGGLIVRLHTDAKLAVGRTFREAARSLTSTGLALPR